MINQRHRADTANRNHCRNCRIDGTRHRLIDRKIDQILIRRLDRQQTAVFTNTIVDNDRVIDRIA